jgi:hypothetical protein
MSTRAQVRFATREEGVSFSEHPEKIHAQFYVHSDGYPEGLGLDIAEMIDSCKHVGSWEIEELQTQHGDLEYIYYIWQGYDKYTYISIFEVGWAGDDEYCKTCQQHIGSKLDRCIFVGSPEKLIESYSQTKND